MKRSEVFFNVAAVPLDLTMLALAGMAAFYARPKLTTIVGPVIYRLTWAEFLWAAVPAIIALIVVFAALGLYNIRGARRLGSEIIKIILGVSAGLFAVVILFFFKPGLFPSRFIILASWLMGIVLVSLGRSILKLVQHYAYMKGRGLHRVVIVNGHGADAATLEREYRDLGKGFLVVKELAFRAELTSDLEAIYKTSPFDEILMANSSIGDEANLKILEWCRHRGLQFSFVPNLFQAQSRTVEVQQVGGVPLINIKNTPLEGWGQVAKRAMDIFLSGLAMIILSPVYLAVFLAVRIGSPGPAIYPALRAGHNKDFWFYKFRSMYSHLSVGLGGEEAEKLRQQLWEQNDRGGKDAPFLKIKKDPRVTPVGKFIRKTKLDEIPQFWNVLKGDMSLVGPRAHVLDEVNRYKDKYPRVFSIKPGVFGISQIEQMNWPDLPFEEEMRLCVYYIENWSLWMDIKILFKSAYLIFFGRKPKEDY